MDPRWLGEQSCRCLQMVKGHSRDALMRSKHARRFSTKHDKSAHEHAHLPWQLLHICLPRT